MRFPPSTEKSRTRLDFHLPFFKRSGLTFSVTLLHVWYNYRGDHTHFGGALGVGYTFF
jgi:hypothetical protein